MTRHFAILLLMVGSLASAQDTAPAKLLLHFTFDQPITGTGQAVASELPEKIPCKWGRAVSGFGMLVTAKDGEPWTADQLVDGRIGHAYRFKGNDAKQWIRVPMTDATDLGSDDFSFAFWLRSEGAAGTLFIRTTTAPYLMLAQQQDGRLRFTIRSEESTQTGVVASNPIDLDGAWHHYAFVGDRDGNGTFFIDGQPAGGGSIRSNAGNLSKPSHLGIGGFGYASGYLRGDLDDFRLYRGKLNPTQIFALANPK